MKTIEILNRIKCDRHPSPFRAKEFAVWTDGHIMAWVHESQIHVPLRTADRDTIEACRVLKDGGGGMALDLDQVAELELGEQQLKIVRQLNGFEASGFVEIIKGIPVARFSFDIGDGVIACTYRSLEARLSFEEKFCK